MSPDLAPDTLAALAASSFEEAGLGCWGLVPEAEARAAFDALPPETSARYGLARAGAVFAAALGYGEGPAEMPRWAEEWAAARPGPLASIGAFARANWYGELVARLKRAAAALRGELGKLGLDAGSASDWRCLANSGLPEKRLALAAGLGSLGRHGLLMTRGAGPACVLGLLLAPLSPPLGTAGAAHPGSSASRGSAFDRDASRGSAFGRSSPGGPGRPPEQPLPALDPACEGCSACVAACPTGALGPGGFARERCLQHWASIAGELPPAIEAAWGRLLYGCDICIEACPRNGARSARDRPAAQPAAAPAMTRGFLGPALPASWLLEASDEELRTRFRGSALGMGWIPLEALRRNAALAAGV